MKKRKIPQHLHHLVSERAQFCCEYCACQEAYSPDPFSTEHIIPEILGGSTTEENLARACQGCNNFKYIKTTAIDPITTQKVPLFHPRKDTWNEHFAWSNDLTELVGLTPVGRATIIEMRLNRENVVNLRRVLILAERHPPRHRST